MRALTAWLLASALPELLACEPASVAEAEARRDVAWLERHESRSSLEALGRLADHDAHAEARLARRTGSADVYHAAWQAHSRSAPWGARVLRSGLSAPLELPLVISEIPARDPRAESFVGELEHAIGAAAGTTSVAAAALLSSLGEAAQPPLTRLIEAPATRDATCTGLAAKTTSEQSRLALLHVRTEARLAAACRKTLLLHMTTETRVIEWLGDSGEPELLVGAAETLACPKLAMLWERVFASQRETIAPLELALTTSTARCDSTLDPVLSRALLATPRVRASVLRVLASEATQSSELPSSCKQLPRLAHGRSVPEDVRRLSTSLLATRCKT